MLTTSGTNSSATSSGSNFHDLRLARVPNDSTFKRMMRTLDALGRPGLFGGSHKVVECLYNESAPRMQSVGDDQYDKWTIKDWYNEGLNFSQKDAVQSALRQEDIGILLGPPGTGKTTTLVEVIRQLVARKQRVIVCAASNIAVDNIVERLSTCKISMVRLGHPARLLGSVRQYSLDAVVSRSAGSNLLNDITKEIEDNIATMKKKTTTFAERRELRQANWQLVKEKKARERRVVVDVIKSVQVVLATNAGADDKLIRLLEQDHLAQMQGNGNYSPYAFDVCVLDEAAQSLDISSWIPVLKARRVILAGDHHQLPPTVTCASHSVPDDESFRQLLRKNFVSQVPKRDEMPKLGQILSDTLFAKLYRKFGGAMLAVQYRMHKDIMTFSSREFYGGKLIADDSVADARISDDLSPIVFVDTSDAGFEEDADRYDSKFNLGEVQIVAKACADLVETHGIAEADIGVIAPYNAQVDLLREAIRNYYNGGKKLRSASERNANARAMSSTAAPRPGKKDAKKERGRVGVKTTTKGNIDTKEQDDDDDDVDLGSGFHDIEISTVDGFQGREKDVIIISLVRCNLQGDVGFLADKRRLNVAITRARRHLLIVGDSNTCSQNEFLKRLVAYWEEVADYKTSSELEF